MILLALFSLVLAGCRFGKRSEPVTLAVGAAADLQMAFTEIGDIFAQKTGVKPTFSFGSSGILSQQIENGAPLDLFAAADRSYVEGLRQKGMILPDSEVLYARGKLVLAGAAGVKIGAGRLEDLLDPAIKKVALANPDHAPYGRAAREALQKAGIWTRLESKLVYGNNIRDTQTLVETGNAEEGLLALSLVKNSALRYTLVDQALYQPLDQAMAVVKRSKNQDLARKFIQLVRGPEGRAILEKYGFEVPAK